MKDFDELEKRTKLWFEQKGIVSKENVFKQFCKMIEEVGELAGGIFRDQKEETTDAVGDVFITLIGVCEDLDLDFKTCFETALEVVENRKTKTIDGKVIKEEDLK